MTKTTLTLGVASFALLPSVTLAQDGVIGHPGGAATNGGGGTTGAVPANGGPGAPARPPSPLTGLFPILMIGLLVFIVVSTFMGSRRQKREREALMGSLKKNDRVQTSGGVIGSIVELKDNEVVLKVDPATNARITFSKGAVQQVLQSAATSAD